MLRLRTSLAVLALAACLGQCGLTAQTREDAEIEKQIRDRLARGKMASDHFRVKVVNGAAILDGQTSVPQRKGAATRIAKSSGASKVENRIRVTARGAQGPPKKVEVLH